MYRCVRVCVCVRDGASSQTEICCCSTDSCNDYNDDALAAAIRANTTTPLSNGTSLPLPAIPQPSGGAHGAGGGKQITCSNKQTVITNNYVSTTHEGGQTCAVNDWCVTGTTTATGSNQCKHTHAHVRACAQTRKA